MKWLHFIGIKGVGMSALAIVAKGMGYTITGSDVAEEFITDSSLKDAGIVPFEGFSADNITPEIDLVILGAAFGADNPEITKAQELDLKTLSYAKLLAELAKEKKTVAIAGTHGKTTTSSLASFLFYQTNQDPSWVIGTGHVAGLPSHGYAGKGTYFITEADDYKISQTDSRPKFAELSPFIAVITSIEHDHPDLYPTLEDCIAAFRILIENVTPDGFLVVNGDDENIRQLMNEYPHKKFVTYGFNKNNDYCLSPDESGMSFVSNNKERSFYYMPIPGKHNIYNAAAALIIALKAGLPQESLQAILPTFKNVERRYQYVGTAGDLIIIDDYAHHPTAVTTTLEAARKQYPQRPLWCLFQSHTYSRTKALLKEFGTAFGPADTVIITDIFGSAREQGGDVTAEDLVREIANHHPNVHYCPKEGLAKYLKDYAPTNAVLITMGAGDIYKIGKELLTTS